MRASASTTESYLRLSQISLFSLLLVCSLIIPAVSERNGGVSSFGDHLSTVVPYSLSFLLCIIFLCLAAKTVLEMGASFRVMAYLLLIIAFFDFLILISTFPRRVSPIFYQIHDWLGIALYTYEFLLSIWFISRQWKLKTAVAFSVECFGSIVGLLSSLKIIHFLYYGQVIGALGFGILLVVVFPYIIDMSRVREDNR
jgi:hypothetical protein